METTYDIEFERAALKGQRGIQAAVLADILTAIEGLRTNPRPHGIKALTGPLRGHYRMQVGAHYRVLYTVDDRARVVTIVNLGSREGIY